MILDIYIFGHEVQLQEESSRVRYDYASIMHYPWNANSNNGQDTMEPIRPLHGKTPNSATMMLCRREGCTNVQVKIYRR